MEDKINIPQQKQKDTRLYYIDWTRSVAVHIVVWLHCLRTLDEIFHFEQSNELIKQKMDSIVRYLVQIGIPTFFLLSGMGLSFYKTEKSSFAAFFINKFNRLIVPLIVCFIFLLIPTLYFEQIFSKFSRLSNGERIEMDFFKYVPQILQENIETKISQFWFLIVLMIVFLINYPLVCWSRRRFHNQQFDLQDLKIISAQIIAVVAWSAICFMLIGKNKEDYWNYIMPSHFILIFTFGIYFGFQVYLQNYKDDKPKAFLLLLMIGPICSIFLNFYKYVPENLIDMYGMQFQINYHIIFTTQGVCNQIWTRHIQQQTQQFRQSVAHPFFIGLSFFLYGVFHPGNYSELGFQFFYPIYGDIILNCLFTTGTWQTIYFTDWIFWSETNKKFDQKIFKFFTESSMFIYLVHDLWEVLVASFLIYPYVEQDKEIDFLFFGLSFIAIVILTELMSFANYYAFNYVYDICSKKKNIEIKDIIEIEQHQGQKSEFERQYKSSFISEKSQNNQGNINQSVDDIGKQELTTE